MNNILSILIVIGLIGVTLIPITLAVALGYSEFTEIHEDSENEK